MRILLDESLPRTLARHFAGVSVETVFDRGWSGFKNGELLRRAATDFDVFFTADQNLQYQQNLRGYEIAVVVMAAVTNRVSDLRPLIEEALGAAEGLLPGEVIVVQTSRD